MVEGWPPGGLAVGLLPDASDPERSARAVLLLAAAAAELREAPLLLDLAPSATDLATRFGAAGKAGFAELVTGKAELWEIVHPARGREAFYVPAGRRAPDEGLASSRPIRTLAERVRRREHLLFVVLDSEGAVAAASAGGILDGYVRLSRESDQGQRALPSGARRLGSLTWAPVPAQDESDERPSESERARWTRRRGAGRGTDLRTKRRRSLRRRRRVGRWAGRALTVLVAVIVLALASAYAPAVMDGHGGWTLEDTTELILRSWRDLIGAPQESGPPAGSADLPAGEKMGGS